MRQIYRVTILAIGALLSVALLGSTGCRSSSETLKSNPNIEHQTEVKGQHVQSSQREIIDKKLLSTQMTAPFDSSLEMKENVDFLLTPALIVQEALSDDVVLTYPTE